MGNDDGQDDLALIDESSAGHEDRSSRKGSAKSKQTGADPEVETIEVTGIVDKA